MPVVAAIFRALQRGSDWVFGVSLGKAGLIYVSRVAAECDLKSECSLMREIEREADLLLLYCECQPVRVKN